MKKPKQTVSQVKRLMDEWDYEKNASIGLFPDKLGSQSNEHAFWKCKYGHSWRTTISSRYSGCGCPKCSKRLKTSFPEQAVFFYIKRKLPDAINSYKEIFKKGMELDIYIPSIKTGIEYDGIAWHKDESLEKERRKYNICKENSIKLIRLKENRKHCNDDSLDVADCIIWVKKPFTGDKKDYYYLDYGIKEVLYYLGDYDIMSLFGQQEKQTLETFHVLSIGPNVKTNVNTRRDKNMILESYLAIMENNSFGQLYPEIAKLWHPTKNGDLTPFMFPPHSIERMWWKGECGHEWDNPISMLTAGNGCPYCSGQRVLVGFNDLETLFPDVAKQWDPILNGDNKPYMYTSGSGHKAFWRCPSCNQTWRVAIHDRTSFGRGCPYCAHEKPIKGVNDLVTLRPDLMEEWDYEKNEGIDPTDLMPMSNKQVWWICSKCGHRYKSYVANRNKGTGCKQCAGQILIKGVNDLETLYPEIAKEWDYELNEGLKPSDIFPKTNKNYNWICSLGHRWTATPNSRTYGRRCPVCSGAKVLAGFNDLATTHPEIAKEWDYGKNGDLKPTMVSKGYKDKVWFKCPVCGKSYDSFLGNKTKGFGKCPNCSSHKSRAQKVLLEETGQTFKTLKEAAMSIGKTDIRLIQMCCTGRVKSAYGYHWKYVKIESD